MQDATAQQSGPDRPITVMYVTDTFISPPGNPVGGAEKQLYLLATSLDKTLFRPIVVQLSPYDYLPIARENIGSVEVYNFPVKRLYSINGMRQFKAITSLAKQKNVDIIHTFFEKSEVIGALVKQFAGVPVWATARRDLGFKRKRIYTEFFRLAGKQCNKCVVNCEAIKKQMVINERVASDSIDVIYNGLDMTAFDTLSDNTLRDELKISEHIQLVGMVANMYHEIKGHRYFLEAAKLIVESRNDVEFVLVGDGWLRNSLENMAHDLGIAGKVHFLGTRSTMPPIISSFAVSVLCSTSEGFSNVILESMASAKPVVATLVGGSAEMVIDGVTGYLIPPADSSALASSIITMLNNPSKSYEMGIAGKNEVNMRFSVQAMVAGYEKLYHRLLER